jgi:hypothetical protein
LPEPLTAERRVRAPKHQQPPLSSPVVGQRATMSAFLSGITSGDNPIARSAPRATRASSPCKRVGIDGDRDL